MEKRNHPEVSIVLPCRNEEQSLGDCILRIQEVLEKYSLNGEIIISDSSTDSSPEIAKKFNVELIKHDKEGYGNAYLEGFKRVRGDFIFCADSDGTYDFDEIPRFLSYLRDDYDLVIGNRFGGSIEKGAMPYFHRYIGTPILSLIFRLLFKIKLYDTQCGMRALTKKALDAIDLRTTGMEFASEMIVKTVNNDLKIIELPINYYSRKGESKLKSLSDGWRHLRFMFMHSPFLVKVFKSKNENSNIS